MFYLQQADYRNLFLSSAVVDFFGSFSGSGWIFSCLPSGRDEVETVSILTVITGAFLLSAEVIEILVADASTG